MRDSICHSQEYYPHSRTDDADAVEEIFLELEAFLYELVETLIFAHTI